MKIDVDGMNGLVLIVTDKDHPDVSVGMNGVVIVGPTRDDVLALYREVLEREPWRTTT